MEKYEYVRVTIGSVLAVYKNIIPDNGDKICVVPAPNRLCPNYVSGPGHIGNIIAASSKNVLVTTFNLH